MSEGKKWMESGMRDKLQKVMDEDAKKVASGEGAPSMVQRIVSFDLVDAYREFLGQSMIIDPKTAKMREIGVARTIGYDDPWIYTHPDQERRCHHYTRIVNKLKYIPKKCMNCWKVVARPQNLKETFVMLRMQEDMAKQDDTCWCKIGAEFRPWVHGNWGAYFYNNSQEAGKKKWQWVREMTDKYIGEHVPVILKRGCTEFEREFGPSDTWDKQFNEDVPTVKVWNEILENHYEIDEEQVKSQPNFIQKHVMAKWVAFAWDRGDPTVIELNDGRPLLPPLVFYHGDLQRKYVLEKMKNKMKGDKVDAKPEIKDSISC